MPFVSTLRRSAANRAAAPDVRVPSLVVLAAFVAASTACSRPCETLRGDVEPSCSGRCAVNGKPIAPAPYFGRLPPIEAPPGTEIIAELELTASGASSNTSVVRFFVRGPEPAQVTVELDGRSQDCVVTPDVTTCPMPDRPPGMRATTPLKMYWTSPPSGISRVETSTDAEVEVCPE